MARTSTSGLDRFNDALRNLDDQLQELRDRFEERRKQFESDFQKGRDRVEERVRGTSLYKRARQVRTDLEDQIERTRGQVYDVFGIASKAELEKLNRKLNAISRKLNELTREQRHHASPPSPQI